MAKQIHLDISNASNRSKGQQKRWAKKREDEAKLWRKRPLDEIVGEQEAKRMHLVETNNEEQVTVSPYLSAEGEMLVTSCPKAAPGRFAVWGQISPSYWNCAMSERRWRLTDMLDRDPTFGGELLRHLFTHVWVNGFSISQSLQNTTVPSLPLRARFQGQLSVPPWLVKVGKYIKRALESFTQALLPEQEFDPAEWWNERASLLMDTAFLNLRVWLEAVKQPHVDTFCYILGCKPVHSKCMPAVARDHRHLPHETRTHDKLGELSKDSSSKSGSSVFSMSKWVHSVSSMVSIHPLSVVSKTDFMDHHGLKEG